MSFNICRGTLGSLAMVTAMTNASLRTGRGHGPDRRYQLSIVENSEQRIDGGLCVGMLRDP
jgi:hypothetical protein